MFEYKAEIFDDDDNSEIVVVTLRNFDRIPTEIWWDSDEDDDGTAQLKKKLKWGLLNDEAVANFKRMPESQLPTMFGAWQESAGITDPESEASSASSTDTVKPSRQTSSATDSG